MDNWYYARGGHQVGPCTEQQLHGLAAQGQLTPADMVWRDGMAQWAPAGSALPGLFGGSRLPPPPLPVATGYAQPPAYPYDAPPRRKSGMPGWAWALIAVCVVLVLGMGSILLPALNRAREQANRIQCASNMRQLGAAMYTYASNNKGIFPADLQTALRSGSLNPQTLNCPSDNPNASTSGTGPSSSYIYTGSRLRMSAARLSSTGILFEKPTAHRKDGMNVLFADGHAEFVLMAKAQPMLQKAQADEAARNQSASPRDPQGF